MVIVNLVVDSSKKLTELRYDMLKKVKEALIQCLFIMQIGHTFLLGTRYSKAFNICYKNAENSNDLTWMGCFGIGVTRLVATCLEQMSSENNVKLPVEIAPYLGVVIPQKEGHRFDETLQVAERIAHQLSKLSNSDDFLFDDRHHLSIGKRLNDSHGSGIPLAIVAGKTALGETPMVEVYWRPGGASNSKYEKPLLTVSESDLLYQLRKLFQTVGVNI